MKNIKIQFTYMIALLAILLSTQSVAAQEEAHYFEVTTWKLQIPEDGSRAELNTVMKEWYQKVVLKNPKVLSRKVLVHISGADMRDWVIITEYANWNDINEAGNLNGKLVAEGWPDEAKRKQFFDTFNKYAITHSDEILQEVPELTKN